MNVSARLEYACVALVELALHHGTDQPVRVRQIAESQRIPARFLVQILLHLKSAGLVASTRGASGGYQLAKPPQEICLADVVGLFDSPSSPDVTTGTQPTPVARVLAGTWEKLAELERQRLRSITIASLAIRVRDVTEKMYYI